MSVTITFWGAAGTVTGSKYLLEVRRPSSVVRVLVDAGMFQGQRIWRERNWDGPEPALLKEIDCCLLTHAHVDHTGILPRFVNHGLKCPVYCTAPTASLAGMLLMDSAHLQGEDVDFRERKAKPRHQPPLPLYTEDDAASAIKLFRHVPFGKRVEVAKGVEAEWRRQGHILGAGSVTIYADGKKITFSGDVGRYAVPILKDPEPVDFGDMLLIESTYGDRSHGIANPALELERVVRTTVERGGSVVIPSFAVGRCQLLLYYLRELKESRKIPDIPIIVDSPSAEDATATYSRFPDDYDEEALGILKAGRRPFVPSKLYFTKSREESKKLNSIQEPMVIISASGMLSGGRVLHHLTHRLPDPRNTVLFVGFMPPGSRGDRIKNGSEYVSIFNRDVPVRANVEEMSACSAHADKDELLRWCRSSKCRPGKVVVVHGEPETARNFRNTLESELSWTAQTADYMETIEV